MGARGRGGAAAARGGRGTKEKGEGASFAKVLERVRVHHPPTAGAFENETFGFARYGAFCRWRSEAKERHDSLPSREEGRRGLQEGDAHSEAAKENRPQAAHARPRLTRTSRAVFFNQTRIKKNKV